MERRVESAVRREMTRRICGKYLATPGLELKPKHARRLCGIDDGFSGELLESLVKSRFLRRKANGKYVRASAD
jgi:hypothetical protein